MSYVGYTLAILLDIVGVLSFIVARCAEANHTTMGGLVDPQDVDRMNAREERTRLLAIVIGIVAFAAMTFVGWAFGLGGWGEA